MNNGEYVKTQHGYELAASLPDEHIYNKDCACEKCQRERSKLASQNKKIEKQDT